MRIFIPIHFLFATEPRRARLLVPLVLLAAGLCATPMLLAQQPAATPAPVHRTAHPHKRATATPAQAAEAPVVEAPPEPVVPKWPVNEKPGLAAVVWDSHGLRIEAKNSSLHQILEDVSTATGAKVEGMGSDERIFGAYGPGQARDVLSQLLQGSGYNILMVGDQGQGAPRQIVLSSRRGGEAPVQASGGNPAGDQDDDADTEEPPIPAQAPPIRPAFAPGAQPRTPQQIMQEMQQRQQMMQQREQPAPTQPPTPTPPPQ
jgi:hypothetical protein